MGGEIVSADSMQIYKEMNIGTAKPSKEEMQGIKHYLLDFVSPDKRYSVAEYKKDAIEAIDKIIEKGKIPIVIGGTGLYINSLIYGIEYPEIEIDLNYREKLEEIAKSEGISKLYEMAKQIDIEAMKTISPNDKKRICRVLEIYHATGKTKTQQEEESRKNGPKYNYLVFGINMEREKLYDRINKRVDIMIENGLIEEVKEISQKYKEFPTAMQGLGYKEVVEYLSGKTSKEEMIDKIKMETRRYAKRQLTWFRRYENMIWLDGFEDVQKNIDIIWEEYSGK